MGKQEVQGAAQRGSFTDSYLFVTLSRFSLLAASHSAQITAKNGDKFFRWPSTPSFARLTHRTHGDKKGDVQRQKPEERPAGTSQPTRGAAPRR